MFIRTVDVCKQFMYIYLMLICRRCIASKCMLYKSVEMHTTTVYINSIIAYIHTSLPLCARYLERMHDNYIH